jgi:hypothetical protein
MAETTSTTPVSGTATPTTVKVMVEKTTTFRGKLYSPGTEYELSRDQLNGARKGTFQPVRKAKAPKPEDADNKPENK